MFSWMGKILESQFLLCCLSVILQLRNVNLESTLNQLGFALSLLQVVLYLYFNLRTLYLLNRRHSQRSLRKVRQMVFGYFVDLREFSFTKRHAPRGQTILERISGSARRNYHFFGLLKKIISLLIVVYLEDKRRKLEVLGWIHLLMLALTMVLLPYNNHILNAGKVASDLVLVLYIFTLWQIEAHFQRIKVGEGSGQNAIRLYY